jgi:hypothetical protein
MCLRGYVRKERGDELVGRVILLWTSIVSRLVGAFVEKVEEILISVRQ